MNYYWRNRHTFRIAKLWCAYLRICYLEEAFSVVRVRTDYLQDVIRYANAC